MKVLVPRNVNVVFTWNVAGFPRLYQSDIIATIDITRDYVRAHSEEEIS